MRLKRRTTYSKPIFLQHRGGCHAMEGRGVIAQYDPILESFTIWSATQCPYLVRRSLASQFELPESRIRVIANDVGGGFGPKAGFYIEEIITPWAARKLGRPIKWIEDRREHFFNHKHSAGHLVGIGNSRDRQGQD